MIELDPAANDSNALKIRTPASRIAEECLGVLEGT
jgi:hypothetical protein